MGDTMNSYNPENYEAPALTEIGILEDLTQGATPPGGDSMFTGS